MTPRDYYGFLFATALVDGELQNEERDHLESFARRLKLSPAEVAAIERNTQTTLETTTQTTIETSGGRPELSVPAKPADRDRMFRHIVRIAAADGECAESELHLLLSVARQLGKSPKDLRAELEAAGIAPRADARSSATGAPDTLTGKTLEGALETYGAAKSKTSGSASTPRGDPDGSIKTRFIIRQVVFIGSAFLILALFITTRDALVALLACLSYAVIGMVVWRCPSCGGGLDANELFPLNCYSCKVPLASQAAHERWSDRIGYIFACSLVACALIYGFLLS